LSNPDGSSGTPQAERKQEAAAAAVRQPSLQQQNLNSTAATHVAGKQLT
jgi:hypothetical protein